MVSLILEQNCDCCLLLFLQKRLGFLTLRHYPQPHSEEELQSFHQNAKEANADLNYPAPDPHHLFPTQTAPAC